MADKLSGAPCCTPSTRMLSPGHSPPSRSHQDGQHGGGSIYKSPRRCVSRDLLLWADQHLLSIRAVHVPGSLNYSADLLLRGRAIHGDWRLHPLTVNMIWGIFGRVEVDLFASAENAQCPLFYSLTHSYLGKWMH